MRHESPGMAFDLVAPTLSFDLLAFLVGPATRFYLLHNTSTLVVTLVVTRRATARQKATPGDIAEAAKCGFRNEIDFQRRWATPSDRRLMASN